MSNAPLASGRRRLVERAQEGWVRRLSEPEAERGLLTFSDPSVDLSEADPAALGELLGGRRLLTSSLLDGSRRGVDADATRRRLCEVHARDVELREERGIGALHLGCGLAGWDGSGNGGITTAPLLVRRLSMDPTSPTGEDFHLALAKSGMQLNPVLVLALQSQFGLSLDRSELGVWLDGALDSRQLLSEAYAWAESKAAGVPGFTVYDRLVVGAFSSLPLSLVEDLSRSTERLVVNDMVAAIAGDKDARDALAAGRGSAEVAPDAPNRADPDEEFLVVDADASQHRAINVASTGQSLVVAGAPGTGKSQTVVNLISTLVADGKSVLFVAEKSAAIDAVTRRLGEVGMGWAVEDVRDHDALGRGAPIGSVEHPPAVAGGLSSDDGMHDALTDSRRRLLSYAQALHEERAAWGLSRYAIQAELMSLQSSSASDLRFPGHVMGELDVETMRRVQNEVGRLADLGGTTLAPESTLWSRAPVATPAEARRAQDLVENLRALLPRVRGDMVAMCEECSLPAVKTFAEWSECLDFWSELNQFLADASPEIYLQDVDGLRRDLMRAPQSGVGRAMAGVFSGRYKSSRAIVRSMLGAGSDAELLDRLELVARHIERWRSFGGSGAPTLPDRLTDARSDVVALTAKLDELGKALGREDQLAAEPPDDLQALIDNLHGDQSTLLARSEMRELRTSLVEAGLGDLLALLVDRQALRSEAQQLFRYAWLASALDSIRFSDQQLGVPAPPALAGVLEDFRDRDRRQIMTASDRLARRHAARATRGDDDGSAREAVSGRPEPEQTWMGSTFTGTPCWATSPLQVSDAVPREMSFDVVIFDEASQIPVHHAVPALARARQAVVVGDRQQLPPEPGSEAADSLLDALGPWLETVTLDQHYRSLDEQLFAFSNAHFYDGALTTFPSPRPGAAVETVAVPADAGHAAEADAVVDLVLGRATARPTESLGVLAADAEHAARVEEALRATLADRPELHSFFDPGRRERFFVKSFDRAQGEERDAIIVTLGLAIEPGGGSVPDMGPLGRPGGDRRLNVAVTRARRSTTIVSRVSSDDIDPMLGVGRGAALLRQYLDFTESAARSEDAARGVSAELDAIEADVRDTLAERGLPIVERLGASGRPVELALRHPERTGEFVLAIECDGEAYRSTPTVRDRDRLRQQQLERLGWRFERVFSSEWFDDRQAVAERLEHAWRTAVESVDAELSTPVLPDGQKAPEVFVVPEPPPEPAPQDEPTADDAERESVCPVPAGRKISKYSDDELDQVVRWIESDGVVRNEDELLTEVMASLGFKRRGSRIVTTIERAIDRVRS